MYVFVGKEADQSALQNASVTAEMSGAIDTSYSGMTNQDGWVTFTDVVAGSYAVTAAHAGYTPETATRFVEENENDSAYILLAESSEPQKVLTGIVRDSNGNPVEGAALSLRVHTTEYSLTLYDTATATGDYLFDAIPHICSSGSLSVSAEGYQPDTSDIALAADTTTHNVTLQLPVAVHAPAHMVHTDHVRLHRSSTRDLVISGVSGMDISRVVIVSAHGRILYTATGPAHRGRIVVPASRLHQGVVYAVLYNGERRVRTFAAGITE
jgi:hypothetical protein